MRHLTSTLLAASIHLITLVPPALAAEPTPPGSAPSAPPAPPAPASAPDLVVLKDGSMVRGTIMELKAGEKVQIQTINGELRTYAMTTVEYAGPAAERPTSAEGSVGVVGALAPSTGTTSGASEQVRPKIVLHGERADVSFTSDEPLTFHMQDTSAIAVGPYGAAVAHGYSEICTAPCSASLPAGTHTLALSRSRGAPIEADPVTIPAGGSTVHGAYNDRSGFRIAGGVVLGAGLAVGTVLVLSESCSDALNCGHTQLYAGLAVGFASALVGTILLFTPDKAEITLGTRGSEKMRTAKHVEVRSSGAGLDVLGTF